MYPGPSLHPQWLWEELRPFDSSGVQLHRIRKHQTMRGMSVSPNCAGFSVGDRFHFPYQSVFITYILLLWSFWEKHILLEVIWASLMSFNQGQEAACRGTGLKILTVNKYITVGRQAYIAYSLAWLLHQSNDCVETCLWLKEYSLTYVLKFLSGKRNLQVTTINFLMI